MDNSESKIKLSAEYQDFIKQLKDKVASSRYTAAKAVNKALILLVLKY